MESMLVDKRIEEVEVLEERGDALVGEAKGYEEEEMFEEAVEAQQFPPEEEAKLNDLIRSMDLHVNGDESPDDGNLIADYDEAESFEEALGTPTAAASSVDGGRSEDDILTTDEEEEEGDSVKKLQVAPTMSVNVIDEGGTKEETEIPSNGDYNNHLETVLKETEEGEEARDGIDELDEKLLVSFEKAESFEEVIGTPTVLASISSTEWNKEENLPVNGLESHREEDVKEIDELTEKLQVSFDRAESFEEAIGTPTVLASISPKEWNKEENLHDNGYGSHKEEEDVKEIDGVHELKEKLQVSFEEAIGTPSVLTGIDVEEWNKVDNGHENHEEDVKGIANTHESAEKLQVSFEKAESFEEAIGTPTVSANVVEEELSKEEIPRSDCHKKSDLKETGEVGVDKEARNGLDLLPEKTDTQNSEIKWVGTEDGARNYVEETTDKSEVVPDKEVEVGSRETNGHVNGDLRRSESPESPDLARHGADNAKELKDEEQKDNRNGYVEAAISETKSNDGKQSVEDVPTGTKTPAIETIEHADRSIESAPILREKNDTTQKVNKVDLPPLKQMNQAPARPAGLGRAAPLLEPTPRAAAQQPRSAGSVAQAQPIEEAVSTEAEEHDETREKLQMIRVKFLRLAHRLGQTPHNVVVAQVLYRLGLAEQLRGRNGGRVGAFSFDRASAMAEQLEASGKDPLDFSCTIMVLGKSGVGKSATINSIFDEAKLSTDAFSYGTKKVQDVVGTVQGIKVRVIDTPGLLPSGSDQHHNEKILHSVKRFIKKNPPDIILYLDRLDVQSIDLSDMPLLRTITDIFGASIWFNAIVVLTHAASAPPEGPNGVASSYDIFVTQRSHVVQQAIRQAAGDMRLMNPVSLVENHSACRTNRAGQRVLPNGQVWKPHLLLLSFASKILAEANTLLKLQDSPPERGFVSRPRMPPLPYLLSSLLQPKAAPKLPQEQDEDEDAMDDDDDSSSDEEESEYDELPPFKRLTKAQLSKLSRAQKKVYFEELEYRERLFMKKQLKEERRQRRMMKKMAAATNDNPSTDFSEEEASVETSVPVPMPDLALPASFDSDNPTHRYRYLDMSNQWLVRPVLETHGWDHDIGYDGINVEHLFVVKNKVPISFSGQVTKDKKDASVQMELSSSIKHGEGKGSCVGFDMQTVGKELAYTLRSETKLITHRKNKASAGLSMTLMNDAVSAGFKIEDKLLVNKCFRLLVTAGAITARGDVAYGGSLDATWKDKDPLGRFQSTLGLSVMDWHGDVAVGGNVQSQIPLGRTTNLIARANLNNRGSGQVSLRVNSSEQIQIVLVSLVPLLKKLFDYRPRQMQFGWGQ